MNQTQTTNEKNAAIYVRVSGQYDERTASLESQEASCRKLVEQHGFTVNPDHLLVERHTGKHLHQRKELSRLRQMVEHGEVQCVCFYQLDRLSRGGNAHIWILLPEFRTKGVKLLSVHDDLSDTPMNNMMLSVKAEFAAQELLNIKDRTTRGRKEKIAKGLIPGQGGELFGYRIDKETWEREIKDDEARVVQRIFNEIASAKSTSGIADDLNAEGIPSPATSIGRKTKNNVWYRRAVNAIVRNPAYYGKQLVQVWTKDEAGRKVRNDDNKVIELPDNVTPAIVSEELWTKANEQLSNRLSRAIDRNQDKMMILRGLVWCLRCNRKIHTKTDGRGYSLFVCSSRNDEALKKKNEPHCGAPTISVRWLEHWVWSSMKGILRSKESLMKMIEGMKGDNQLDTLVKDRERLEKRIEDIETDTMRLIRAQARVDDEYTVGLCEREIKNLANHRRAVEESLQDLNLVIRKIELSSPNIPKLIDLQEQFAWGDPGWSDEQKRDYLVAGGFQVFANGHTFEVRLLNGSVVRSFDESKALIAKGNQLDYEPVEADGNYCTSPR